MATFGIGQTIVSTSPENKNVVLEEFTGIHCVWCPDGHAIAQAIQNNNPGNVFLINIHTGGFAVPGPGEPDFRVPDGNGIRAFYNVNSYPSGMVNRHIFSGSSPVMGRGSWTGASNQILSQLSYVNVGVEAEVNVTTREMTVHVEAYYTGNSPNSTNKLNVALLQNNTLGPQTGGGMGDQYVHMHRLLDLITGQWGMDVTTTTTGSFVDETYTYSVPLDINGVPVELADLEVVAFLTETQSEIPSGAGAFPTYTGFAHANDVYARYIDDIKPQCGYEFSPKVNIQNVGSGEITEVVINYSVNGGSIESYTWNGSLLSLQNETVELPAISYTIDTVNFIDISLENDDNNANNNVSANFDNAVIGNGNVHMILNTSTSGPQCTWDLIDSSGTILYSGGPYANNEVVHEDFILPEDCYRFSVYDSGGDGGGAIVLYDTNSVILYNTNGAYDEGDHGNFSSDGVLSVNDLALENIRLYPNPTSTILNISNAEDASIEIFNLLGQSIIIKDRLQRDDQIDVSGLNVGTYLVKISKDNAMKVEKLLINN